MIAWLSSPKLYPFERFRVGKSYLSSKSSGTFTVAITQFV